MSTVCTACTVRTVCTVCTVCTVRTYVLYVLCELCVLCVLCVLCLCRDLVMECLESHDESIRLRALDLIVGMINKKNLMEIVRRLLAHVEESESVRK